MGKTAAREADDRLDTVASLIGEGVHASLRKFCESKQSHEAYLAIRNMPEGEWSSVVEGVAREVLRYLDREG